jgi:hypothetical protein
MYRLLYRCSLKKNRISEIRLYIFYFKTNDQLLCIGLVCVKKIKVVVLIFVKRQIFKTLLLPKVHMIRFCIVLCTV